MYLVVESDGMRIGIDCCLIVASLEKFTENNTSIIIKHHIFVLDK